jgi:hypothetical protein
MSNALLTETSLQFPPTYLALSYVWVRKEPLVVIQINRETYLVTQNLFNALQQLRQASDTATVRQMHSLVFADWFVDHIFACRPSNKNDVPQHNLV